MKNIEWARFWLASLLPGQIPEVDDVRPMRCSQCKVPARRGMRVVLHGHGCRTRMVVVAPALGDDASAEVLECWQRRYKCTACGTILVVLPKGVMPRYLYSTAAIVMALFLVAERPVGEDLSQAEAYDRQGMLRDVTSRAFRDPSYRWRSLGRWARCAKQWWTGWAGDISSLLFLLLQRAGDRGRAEAISVAVDSHVRWGCAM